MGGLGSARPIRAGRGVLGAKDRAPETDTSEIIVDIGGILRWILQRHLPMDVHLFSSMFLRIVTCPMDLHLNCQRCFPMDVHSSEIWRAICCPDLRAGERQPDPGLKEGFAASSHGLLYPAKLV